MRNLHCVIRVFPEVMFFEELGSKKECMDYANSKPKRFLKVCKVTPIVSWDKNGKKKGDAK